MVFADTGSEKEHNNDSLEFLGRKLWLKDKKQKTARGEKIIGYIPCANENGKEGYIRIIQKSKKVFLIPVLILLLLLGGLLGGAFLLNNQGVHLDEAAISYQMPNGMKNENPEEIMIPVFTELTMAKGSKEVTAGLVNPEGNPCYFQYSIYLKKDKELLYQSEWIEPGTAVVEFELKEQLSAGEYPIEIHIKTGSLDNPEIEMNGGEVDCILRVE